MRRVEAHVLQPGGVIELIGRLLKVHSKRAEGSRVVTEIECVGGEHDGVVVDVVGRWDEPVRRLRRGPGVASVDPEPPGADTDVANGLDR